MTEKFIINTNTEYSTQAQENGDWTSLVQKKIDELLVTARKEKIFKADENGNQITDDKKEPSFTSIKTIEFPVDQNNTVNKDINYTIKETKYGKETEETMNLELKKASGVEEIEKIYEFLKENFKPEKLLSLEEFKQNFKGETKDGTKRPKYNFYYIQNKEGEIIAARVSANIDVIDGDNNPTGESIFYAMYIAVKNKDSEERYKGGGFPELLYIAALIDAKLEAERNGQKLTHIFMEAGEDMENTAYKKVKAYPIFMKKTSPEGEEHYEELPFTQPALNFNPQTGRPTDDKEPREHLMIFPFGGNYQITEEQIINIYRTLIIQEYKIEKNKSYFETDEAYGEYEKYFEDLMQKVLDKIKDAEDVVYLSQKQQKELVKAGKQVIHWDIKSTNPTK